MGERARSTLSKKNPYYISPNRRRELKYYCLQYKEWKQYLSYYHLIHSTDEWDDEVSKEAIERARCEKNIKLVEGICKITSSELWEYLLLAVTEDLKEKTLITKYRMPICKNEFQRLRQKFFYLLSQEKHMF